MNWKKILTGTAVFACAAALLTGCGGDKASAPDKGADKSKIIVGLDDNFPPMGFKNEKNEIVGFDVDLAKEAAKRLGREVEFKAIDWSSKEAELKSGRVQILWNGLDITDKRKENMLFSNPYMDNRQIIFVKKGSTAVSDEKSLAGKTIGVQTGTAQEDYATELSEQCVADGKDKITIMPHDLQTDIATKVIGGQYDATLADSTVIGYTANLSSGKIEQVGDVVEPGVGDGVLDGGAVPQAVGARGGVDEKNDLRGPGLGRDGPQRPVQVRGDPAGDDDREGLQSEC